MTRRCRRRHGQGLCGLVAVLGLRYGSSGRDQPRSWRGVRSSPRSGTSGGTLRGGPGPEFWLNLTITPPRPPSGPPDQPAVAGQPCPSPFRQASPAPRRHCRRRRPRRPRTRPPSEPQSGAGYGWVGPKVHQERSGAHLYGLPQWRLLAGHTQLRLGSRSVLR